MCRCHHLHHIYADISLRSLVQCFSKASLGILVAINSQIFQMDVDLASYHLTQTPRPHKLLRWGRCAVVMLIGIQLGIDRVFTSKHCFFLYYHDLIQTVTAHVKIQSLVMECEHQECLTCQEGQAPFP